MIAEGFVVVAAAASEIAAGASASKAAAGKDIAADSVIAAVAVGEQSAAFLAFASENQETYSVSWNFG